MKLLALGPRDRASTLPRSVLMVAVMIVVAMCSASGVFAQGGVELLCTDGLDNDGDGAIDAADPDCSIPFEYLCQDGVDNDNDGFTDNVDIDCQCLEQVDGSQNCTANDVQFVLLGLGTQTDGCVTPEDQISIILTGTLEAQSLGGNTRYDIGLWIGLEGGSAYSGTRCSRQSLQPVVATGVTPTSLQLSNGNGPFRNDDGDTCGEIRGDSNPVPGESYDAVFRYPIPTTMSCADALTSNGTTTGGAGSDGFLDLASCSTWKQSGSATDCRDTRDVLPGTKAKCRCEDATNSDVPVPDLMCGAPSGASAIGTEGVISCVDNGDVVGGGIAGDGILTPGESATCTVRYRNDATCSPNLSTAERFRCATAGYVRYQVAYDATRGSLESATTSGNDLLDTATAGNIVWTPVSPTGTPTGTGIVGPSQFETLTFTYRADPGLTTVQGVNFQMRTFWSNVQSFAPEVDQSPSVMCSATLTTTPVTLGFFRSEDFGNRVVVEWSTATEAGNLGFDLYARTGGGWQRVNEELILSEAVSASEPTTYRFEVDGIDAKQFRVEDVDLRGERRVHGPFVIGRDYGERPEPSAIDWITVRLDNERSTRIGRVAARGGFDLAQAGGGAPPTATGNPNTPPALSLGVDATGIQRVTYEDLLAAGFDFAKVQSADLALSSGGQPVALRMVSPKTFFGPGSFFEFWGEALDTIYTDTNVYLLEGAKRQGTRIGEDATVAGSTPAEASYASTRMVETNAIYSINTPAQDPWVERMLQATSRPVSHSLPLVVDGLLAGGETLHVELWGLTDFVQNPDHHVRVRLNGVVVADRTFDGATQLKLDLPVSGLLVEGPNTLTLELPADTGALADLMTLETYGVTHRRETVAENGALRLASTSPVLEVRGLPSANVVAYRLDGGSPTFLAGAQAIAEPSGGFTVRLPGGGGGIFVADVSALGKPAIATARLGGPLLEGEAEYLVVSHPLFIDHLGPLVAAREASGLSVAVVDVESIYASYSSGITDARAIHAFLIEAAAAHGTEMVLLVGGDTYDYRGFLANGSVSFVPSLYAATDDFVRHAPVDPLYGDVDGDGVPDLAIGRFPVRTVEELGFLVDKTLAYESKSYDGTAVLAADRFDQVSGLSFKSESGSFLAGLGGSWQVENAFLDDLSVTEARQRIVSAVNNGVALTGYFGHSGPTVWTFSGLFRSSDAAALTNSGSPTVVVQWGCWNTYYVQPQFNTLGHLWLASGYQGAAAVLGASTLVEDASARALSTFLAPKLGVPGMPIGRAMVEAKQRLAKERSGLVDVQLGWTLLGDPALALGR